MSPHKSYTKSFHLQSRNGFVWYRCCSGVLTVRNIWFANWCFGGSCTGGLLLLYSPGRLPRLLTPPTLPEWAGLLSSLETLLTLFAPWACWAAAAAKWLSSGFESSKWSRKGPDVAMVPIGWGCWIEATAAAALCEVEPLKEKNNMKKMPKTSQNGKKRQKYQILSKIGTICEGAPLKKRNCM